jgi:hypothetical protein
VHRCSDSAVVFVQAEGLAVPDVPSSVNTTGFPLLLPIDAG